ncbi:hypothetical protein GT030_30040 [Streptomyces sp. SID1328]|uniref:hypothetical protein n=1 Tax=Streptomyces sp. SID1328 TaxID=2690250 RepID=UPI0013937244|nr:hypothetical protein [Streptomyces sp. SID1328]MYV42993.1 hypothetical protein [Streptomyces sp. SID1328]
MQQIMTRPGTRPQAGIIDDIEREDDRKGYEPEEATGHPLREVIPGPRARLLPLHDSGQMQCDYCGGWFGVTFWTCSACQSLSAVFRR